MEQATSASSLACALPPPAGAQSGPALFQVTWASEDKASFGGSQVPQLRASVLRLHPGLGNEEQEGGQHVLMSPFFTPLCYRPLLSLP